VVDAAGTEGRDPIEDIRIINEELRSYNPELLKKPMLIAANKMDAIYEGDENPADRIREAFREEGIPVYPISGVSGQGIRELLYAIYEELKKVDKKPVVFEKEFEVEYSADRNLTYTIERNEDGEFVVEGPRIEKMLGYTNLESEKGFSFFQRFLKDHGILEELENAGIQEGDTVRMYGLAFDYYKE
jgi:GTP-binding protein